MAGVSFTKIIFDLKDEQSEFLEERRLTDPVKKLSEFVGFPIELHVKEKGVTDSGKMKTTIEEEGKEGDELKNRGV